jgi:hypothetical protein
MSCGAVRVKTTWHGRGTSDPTADATSVGVAGASKSRSREPLAQWGGPETGETDPEHKRTKRH